MDAGDRSVYQEHGYANRMAYLQGLAKEHNANSVAVIEIAQLLGPSEDFDGLVNFVEDHLEGSADE